MTLKQLWLHPAAIAEAEDAARWYRERSALAATRFVREVNLVIDKILDVPQRWPQGTRGTRKVKLPCFPFIIVYRELDDTIQILAIAHGRRRPGFWTRRT